LRYETSGLFCLFLAGLTIAVGCASAGENLPFVKKGSPYALARAQLIATGSLPAPWPHDARADCDNDDRCIVYPECINCAGDGSLVCLFRWKTKSGRVFLVETVGETVPQLKVDSVEEPTPDDLHPRIYPPE
jgi:hypothetical protein